MHELGFYRQARFDGGVRTGVGVDGTTVLHEFQPGDEECVDPAILWYADLTCSGEDLPTEAEEVRDWFIANQVWIKQGLSETAEHIALGVDNDLKPFERKLQAPNSIEARVIATGIRRLSAQGISSQLLEIAGSWEQILEQLNPLSRV